MPSLRALTLALIATLRDHLRPLIAFHLLFTLLASALLLPLSAWLIRAWMAQFERAIVTTEALIGLLFSPLGLATLMVGLGLSFLLLYWQQAGMLLVAAGSSRHQYRLAADALWQSAKKLPRLAGLVVLQVGAHLLLMAPFMLALAWLYEFWLGGLDTYYLQQVMPPVLWYFVACALPVVLIWMALAANLYVRWVLALPLVAFEGLAPWRALGASRALTRGWHWPIAVAVLSLLVVIIALPLLATWLFDTVATPLLWWLPERYSVLIPMMLAYLTTYVLLTLAITFVGIAANALLSACLYLQLANRGERPLPPQAGTAPRRFAWALELGVLAVAGLQAFWILNSFELRDDVTIIAHRGSSMVAPENTLAAIRQALDDGADAVELDVRLTADGAVMLYHDRSLARLTGDPRDFDDLTRETLSQFDIGSWFGDAFADERIAGLDDALRTARGRAGLMIDMKAAPGNERRLADAVITTLYRESDERFACWAGHAAPLSALAECGFPDALLETRLATTLPSLVPYLKEQAPTLKVTLLAQLILPGMLDRRAFDALGLRHNRVSDAEIRLAARYGYEVHAWTVNSASRMSALVDMGVDAIITDYPDRLATLMEERRERSDGALLLIKLHNWLRQ